MRIFRVLLSNPPRINAPRALPRHVNAPGNHLTRDRINVTLSSRAAKLYEKYAQAGVMTDLEEAMRLYRQVLSWRGKDHPDRPKSLSNLASCLRSRFDLQGTVADLDEAISHHQAALELRPVGHPDRPFSLDNLAVCLRRRFHSQGTVADLDTAISLHQAALALRPVDCLDRYMSAASLANCLHSRFETQGMEADLDEAISLQQAALKLRPLGHPDRSKSLSSLANCLRSRFDSQGTVADLNEAISLQRTSLELRPLGHPDRSKSLANLASCLRRRFRSQGKMADLDEAISLHQAALELRPVGHPDRSRSLHSLASCLRSRFDSEGTPADLDEAISFHQAALDLSPVGHPDQSLFLGSLGSSLRRRFDSQDTMADLDTAISLHQVALELYSVRHSYPSHLYRSESGDVPLDSIQSDTSERSKHLTSLADCLEARFKRLGTFSDFKDALKIRQNLPDVHFSRSSDPFQSIIDPHPFPHTTDNLSHIKRVVMDVVQEILTPIPPRLIDTDGGTLCDRAAQLSKFEGSRECHQLLMSLNTRETIRQPDIDHIRATIASYFRYVTLSHRWGKDEPLLHHVEENKVYDISDDGMPKTDGLEKLRNFCRVARDQGYSWAWSDTCCIDKTSSAELQEAIGSMFSWYQQSALTVVHLSDVTAASPLSALSSSIWFRRGWTLQELLAPPKLLFYSQNWSPCIASTSSTHKSDPAILKALERTTGIPSRYLTEFRPSVDDARTRLQWASARLTTRSEDIAYSLFGIFDLHLPVLYGEGEEKALGRLLEEVISQSGDTSVLDWVGKASSYHSCFPASIGSYRSPPTMQRTMRDIEFERSMARARQLVGAEDAHKLYDTVAALPFPQFANRRLALPCIVHRVHAVKYKRKAINDYVYEIRASGLRPLTIASSVELKDGSQGTRLPYILVRAWDRNLVGETLEEDEVSAAYRMMVQLGQPFGALLLEQRPWREYKRIASSRIIVARTEGPASIVESEFKTLNIV